MRLGGSRCLAGSEVVFYVEMWEWKVNEDEPALYNVCCDYSRNAKFSNVMRVGVSMSVVNF